MGFKDVDMESAFRRLAERRIEDAMKEGKFDNLPGRGKPLELDEAPTDENARMLWWALRIMKNGDYTPDEVKYRKAIDHLKARLASLADEAHLEPLVTQINDLVKKLNTMGTNAIALAVAPVHLERERAALRDRLRNP